ncbi:MAG: hypothetical protein ACJ0HA_01280 [Dehalococcoidia bacterium]
MSEYLLNSSTNLNDEKLSDEIISIFEKKDIWVNGPFPAKERLGWIDFAKVINLSQKKCSSSLNKINFENIIFIGMGGSIQTGKVLKQLHPNKSILFLDSTNPSEVIKVSRKINNKKNIFIIMSKSGSTIETNAIMNFFINQMKKKYTEDFGKHFIAITDKGTDLEIFAQKYKFLKIITTERDIGGRFSSSTSFGLMPYYALKKGELKKISNSVDEALQKSKILSNALTNEIKKNNSNKINIKISDNISEMGIWLEQLIAESSGKNNKGVTPIVSNLPNSKSLIQIFSNKNYENGKNEKLLNIKIAKDNIFEDMYIWQIAILILCKKINVFPFDEPDVKNSKINTMKIIKSKKNKPSSDMPFFNKNISEIFDKNLTKDVLYLNLYTPENKNLKKSLKDFKIHLKLSKNINSISSFGPRYLHSIGQLQKGGPKNIWAIFFYDLKENNIFDAKNEYNELRDTFNSQMLGDYFALKEEGIESYLININSKNINPFDKILKQIKE